MLCLLQLHLEKGSPSIQPNAYFHAITPIIMLCIGATAKPVNWKLYGYYLSNQSQHERNSCAMEKYVKHIEQPHAFPFQMYIFSQRLNRADNV